MYNALAKQRDEMVSLPVDSSSRFVVKQLTIDGWMPIDNEVMANENYAQVKGIAYVYYFYPKSLLKQGKIVLNLD